MPDIRKDVTPAEIEAWMRTLYRRVGIRTVTFRDGSIGLINVPNKYVQVIDTMHCAMVELAAGDKLPEFVPEEPKKTKKGRKKR